MGALHRIVLAFAVADFRCYVFSNEIAQRGVVQIVFADKLVAISSSSNRVCPIVVLQPINGIDMFGKVVKIGNLLACRPSQIIVAFIGGFS